MDSPVNTHVQATMNALLLAEALKPLTERTPLGEYAAGSFARLIADRIAERS